MKEKTLEELDDDQKFMEMNAGKAIHLLETDKNIPPEVVRLTNIALDSLVFLSREYKNTRQTLKMYQIYNFIILVILFLQTLFLFSKFYEALK